MQKVALRAQLRRCEEERDEARRSLLSAQALADDLKQRLSLARAGLLIALPHVGPESARMIVAYALETSGDGSDADAIDLALAQ